MLGGGGPYQPVSVSVVLPKFNNMVENSVLLSKDLAERRTC